MWRPRTFGLQAQMDVLFEEKSEAILEKEKERQEALTRRMNELSVLRQDEGACREKD